MVPEVKSPTGKGSGMRSRPCMVAVWVLKKSMESAKGLSRVNPLALNIAPIQKD